MRREQILARMNPIIRLRDFSPGARLEISDSIYFSSWGFERSFARATTLFIALPTHLFNLSEEIMINLLRFKRAVGGALAISIALQPLATLAALHPSSYLRTDSATLQTLDMVSNTDWDFDASPPIKSASGQTLDRAYITAVFTQMAKSVFTMTEGRHRIGTVFIYRNNRFGNEVDTKLVGVARGRSNGTVSGWGRRGGTTTNYLEGDPETLGKVIAHENGHYVYGLMDEYREEGKPLNPNDVSDPSEVDTPLDTIMNDHTSFVSFSTAGDNVAPANTANKRWFAGASAWQVLSRPSTADTPEQQRFGVRTAFSAFSGFTPATANALTRPTVGWDAAFKVAFVPDPLDANIYIVSRNMRADQLPGVKNALVESLRKIVLSSKATATVVTYGGNNGVPQAVLATRTIDTEAARADAIAAIEAITVDSAEGSLETALGAVLDAITGQYASNLLFLGDGLTVNLFANTEANISVATRDRIKSLRVAVNTNLITDDGVRAGSSVKRALQPQELESKAMRAKVSSGTVTLAQLAHSTGGHFNDAHRQAALTSGAVKAQSLSGGSLDVTLATKFVTTLPVATPFELKTPVLAKTDRKVTFNAYWANDTDSANIRFSLTAPSGAQFTPANASANQSFANGQIQYVIEADSASAHFEVASDYAGRNGVWTSTVTSTALIASSVEQDVESVSSMRADIDVLKDGSPDPILVTTLATDRAVQGAVATAYFYGADGKLKLTRALLDDGKGGDRKANDGTYSASLGGLLQAGQYDVEVVLTQGPNGASLSTAGLTIKGVNAPAEPLGGAFSRTAETMITVAPTSVTEYYVPSLKKYFITGRETDKSLLAQYPTVYSPTGMSFIAGPGLAPPAGLQSICRFYFALPLANTHFYGVPADCALVASTFAGNAAVTNEGLDFAVAVPDVNGSCPAAYPVKIYRSFNNRSAQNDGNHRYTVSLSRYNQMIGQGYSADGAVFCAASATDATQ